MIHRLLLPLVLIFAVSGCSYFNGTPYESVLGKDKDLIDFAYEISEDLERRAFPPLVARHPDQPILATTFVDNSDYTTTSRFSLLLQQHMTSRFVQRGYTVKEIKLRKNLFIKPKVGEVLLSRELDQIRESQQAQAIMLGTYSFINRTMYISARLVDPVSANIISAADYELVMDKNVLAMFGKTLDTQEDPNLIEEPRGSILNWFLY